MPARLVEPDSFRLPVGIGPKRIRVATRFSVREVVPDRFKPLPQLPLNAEADRSAGVDLHSASGEVAAVKAAVNLDVPGSELREEDGDMIALLEAGDDVVSVYEAVKTVVVVPVHWEERMLAVGRLPSQGSDAVSHTLRQTMDTTARAAAVQLELYRAAGPSRRAGIAVELSEAVRATTLAGIRRRHPDISETELRNSFLRLVYGDSVKLP